MEHDIKVINIVIDGVHIADYMTFHDKDTGILQMEMLEHTKDFFALYEKTAKTRGYKTDAEYEVFFREIVQKIIEKYNKYCAKAFITTIFIGAGKDPNDPALRENFRREYKKFGLDDAPDIVMYCLNKDGVDTTKKGGTS